MSGGDNKGSSEDEIELRSGARVSVRAAMGCFKFLELSREHRPREFDTILAVSRGQAPPDEVEYEGLKEAGIIDEGGKLAPLYQALVESCVEDGRREMLVPCLPERKGDWERWRREEARHKRAQLPGLARLLGEDGGRAP